LDGQTGLLLLGITGKAAMNRSVFKIAGFSVIMALIPALVAIADDSQEMKFGAAGWIAYGQVGHSSDSLNGDDFDGKGLQSYGALISVSSQLSERLSALVGFGVGAGHFLQSRANNNGGFAPLMTGPFVKEASFVYSFKNEEDSKLSLKTGYFENNYNPDAQNMGLYLLRGPVYPGVLISGFEVKSSTIMGIQLHQQLGNFDHDLILSSEIELYPWFDLSPAYLASYHFGKVLRLGAGVNLYHYISIEPLLTTHKTKDWEPASADHPFQQTWIYIDSTTPAHDTTYMSFKGTKVMVQASLDIKEILGGIELMGSEDLKLYSEIAIVGLDNSKAYKALYGGYANRMPIMVGFNIPVFGFLDKLSIEVESYTAKFRDDLIRNQHSTSVKQSPIPVAWPTDTNPNAITRDDIKWSLYGTKTLDEHVKLSFQFANDHFRPGVYAGIGDNNPPRQEAILFTKKDWYWMSKVAFFF
jgi:hypothetical protein